MDAQAALDYIDDLIFAKFGKPLNDLEREVFIGSWQDKTYKEIYPYNPEYIEKSVGYQLWQKISTVLADKVSKKNFKRPLERHFKNTSYKTVLISYQNQEPDTSLATQLEKAIAGEGHQVFVTPVGINQPHLVKKTTDWLSQIDHQLRRCDYFLLLLSPQASVSEIVLEQLKQTKELRDFRGSRKPIILPIRVNCPACLPFNHDLRSYLLGTCQREWKSATDTASIIEEIKRFLSQNIDWANHKKSIPSWEEWKTVGIEEWEREISLASNQTLDLYPLPVAEPELPQGQVRLASAFYIKRDPFEEQCYQEITSPGALIRIKAPRQMGKTSLMARILYHTKEQGFNTVPLSFQHADQSVFNNLDQLLRWFCIRIARKLRLPYKVDEYWADMFGSKDNCTAFFEDCILPDMEMPLVLGLDEVDRVFQHPHIADDFFSLLRAWYEEAGYGTGDSNLWEKLRLVIVHSTEVYIPLDINQSPFNVGLPIELTEFTPEQVADLAHRHGLNWQEEQIQKLMKIVGGHPYLVRVAMYHIVREHLTLENLAETASTEAGIYGDHLRRHLWNLQKHPELLQALSQVVTVRESVELKSVLAFKLHSMGLVDLQGDRVTPRCDLYRQYFSHRFTLEPLDFK
ncbi:AAA-like domain-containing protein [Lyngbya sp. PCC 8106]|uniref:AAA-like domain-containing protein n=1 Tax=Lyngbya sp. (strain PCC 8106) TaxID=313612 RepID=UPI0000EAA30C|nr:AAA-like domain-containing protein [Lyngbya sp. PCC 8106]EAW37020.1 serine/threonine protein kinase [Lyngbya sp. PCC 8106]